MWLTAYVVFLASVIAGVFYGRRQALAIYGSSAAQAEWDAWDDAKKMAEEPQSVKCRVPWHAQPPARVLMRDYFAVCLGVLWLIHDFVWHVHGPCPGAVIGPGRVGYAHQQTRFGGHSPPYDY